MLQKKNLTVWHDGAHLQSQHLDAETGESGGQSQFVQHIEVKSKENECYTNFPGKI